MNEHNLERDGTSNLPENYFGEVEELAKEWQSSKNYSIRSNHKLNNLSTIDHPAAENNDSSKSYQRQNSSTKNAASSNPNNISFSDFIIQHSN